MSPSGDSSGASMEHKAPAALTLPNAHQPGGLPVVFTSPLPPHMNDYMYGYPQAAPHPSVPSPAVNQRTNHPQQPQQMYWPSPVGSPHL